MELLDLSKIPDTIDGRDLLSGTVDDLGRRELSSGDLEHLGSDVDTPLLESRGVVHGLNLRDSCLQHGKTISRNDGSENERLGSLIRVEFLGVLLSRYDIDELDRPQSDLADLDARPIGSLKRDTVVLLEVGLST